MSRKHFDTRSVTLVSFAHLVHDTFGSFLAPLMPLLIAKLGFSLFLAGLLDVVRKVPALFNPLVGRYADRYSKRWFVILAPLVTAVGMSLLGLAPNYGVLLGLILVAGVGSTLFHVPAPVLVAGHSGARVGRGMSFYMVGGELARTVGPLLVLGAVSWWGLEGTWRLIPIGMGASLLLWQKFKRVEKPSRASKNRQKLPGQGGEKILLGLSGMVFLRAGMKASVTIYLPTLLTSRGHSLWLAGIALSVLQFTGTLGVLFSGTLSDYLGRRRLMMLMNLFAPLTMVLFMVAPPWALLPVLVVLGPTLFGTGPVMLATLHQVKREDMAYINGLYMTLNFLLNSAMILTVGVLADQLGYRAALWISLSLAFFALPFGLFLPHGAQDRTGVSVSEK